MPLIIHQRRMPALTYVFHYTILHTLAIFSQIFPFKYGISQNVKTITIQRYLGIYLGST